MIPLCMNCNPCCCCKDYDDSGSDMSPDVSPIEGGYLGINASFIICVYIA